MLWRVGAAPLCTVRAGARRPGPWREQSRGDCPPHAAPHCVASASSAAPYRAWRACLSLPGCHAPCPRASQVPLSAFERGSVFQGGPARLPLLGENSPLPSELPWPRGPGGHPMPRGLPWPFGDHQVPGRFWGWEVCHPGAARWHLLRLFAANLQVWGPVPGHRCRPLPPGIAHRWHCVAGMSLGGPVAEAGWLSVPILLGPQAVGTTGRESCFTLSPGLLEPSTPGPGSGRGSAGPPGWTSRSSRASGPGFLQTGRSGWSLEGVRPVLLVTCHPLRSRALFNKDLKK